MTCLIKDTSNDLVVFLESLDSTPATGLSLGDVQIDAKKSSDAGFHALSLDPGDFAELDAGFYRVSIPASLTDTLGLLYVRITGASIKTYLDGLTVMEEPTVIPPSPGPTIPITLIYGYIRGADGAPAPNASVSARTLSQPTVLHPGLDGLVLSSSLVTTKTDSSGYFILNLVAGATVDFFIPEANYRRTFKVPYSSCDVFDIP